MPTRTRSASRSEAATLSEAAMDRALGDPLIVRHILLQAAAGDARRVGRLAKAGRTFYLYLSLWFKVVFSGFFLEGRV